MPYLSIRGMIPSHFCTKTSSFPLNFYPSFRVPLEYFQNPNTVSCAKEQGGAGPRNRGGAKLQGTERRERGRGNKRTNSMKCTARPSSTSCTA
ncbi:hypothetical protein GYMLUDRAFT_459981 [Collybiopsis luxurians FD-317 M1]|uniref:Uncharacterized protein n=1 Tax=Collybiopsis luxurians FD-317 M1 TaxID=944289 RepID=A0A0D0AJY9_9AGAR|nr:hypothetical protein GYMLUDRAFT_459981 [Collybiopsis luxurians FD-317 M1]